MLEFIKDTHTIFDIFLTIIFKYITSVLFQSIFNIDTTIKVQSNHILISYLYFQHFDQITANNARSLIFTLHPSSYSFKLIAFTLINTSDFSIAASKALVGINLVVTFRVESANWSIFKGANGGSFTRTDPKIGIMSYLLLDAGFTFVGIDHRLGVTAKANNRSIYSSTELLVFVLLRACSKLSTKVLARAKGNQK